jgi:hypothetical protein
MLDLAAIAKSLVGVDEGVACAGTALESHTFRVNGKAFLFLSKKEARVKLAASLAEAARLGCAAGAHGWVKFEFDAPPPANVLKRWIAESHALLGGSTTAPKRARTPTSETGSARRKRPGGAPKH